MVRRTARLGAINLIQQLIAKFSKHLIFFPILKAWRKAKPLKVKFKFCLTEVLSQLLLININYRMNALSTAVKRTPKII